MSSVKITEVSANMMHIEIGSEWFAIGKSMVMQYAEGLAKAYSIGSTAWKAQQVNPSREDEGTLVVKLVRVG